MIMGRHRKSHPQGDKKFEINPMHQSIGTLPFHLHVLFSEERGHNARHAFRRRSDDIVRVLLEFEVVRELARQAGGADGCCHPWHPEG